MRRHILSSIIMICCSLLPAAAASVAVKVEAGELPSKIASPETVTTLTINGYVDASDLAYIAELPALETLDMSGTTIVAWEGRLFGSTVTRYAANSIPANMFAGSRIKTVILPKTKELVIGPGAFACSQLASIKIPSSVAKVGDGAFAYCPQMTEVVVEIPQIGKGLFHNCPKLKSVRFLRNMELPVNTFYGCVALEKVEGPGFISVGERALSHCSSLKSFPFNSLTKEIGRESFMKSGLEKVDLSSCQLDSIGEWAFAMMPRLTTLITGNVVGMGQAIAFACPNLVTFETSESATELPDYALTKSAAVDTTGLLHDGIERIGRYAMSGLSGIHAVYLPQGLKMLDDHAMENMTSLETIYSNLYYIPELGEDVWAGINQADVELVVPNQMTQEYKNAEQWCEFDVVNTSSSVDAVLGEDKPNIRAKFDGDDLIVQAEGVDIDRLTLYNPAGQLLIAVEPMSETIAVNTAGFGTRLFIVHAALSDGRAAAVKISKGR